MTMTDAVPDTPPLVAVIVTAGPAAIALTMPVLDTVAVLSFDDDHVTVRPVSGFPPASRGCADICTESPAVIEVSDGVTTTEPTATGLTVTAALPLFPSLVAVMFAVP